MRKYDVLKYLSQRKNGEMPEENEILVSLANNIRRATAYSGADEEESGEGSDNVGELNEREKRYA